MKQQLINQIAFWQIKQQNEIRSNFNFELYLKILKAKTK
jgi:hypothetical protein